MISIDITFPCKHVYQYIQLCTYALIVTTSYFQNSIVNEILRKHAAMCIYLRKKLQNSERIQSRDLPYSFSSHSLILQSSFTYTISSVSALLHFCIFVLFTSQISASSDHTISIWMIYSLVLTILFDCVISNYHNFNIISLVLLVYSLRNNGIDRRVAKLGSYLTLVQRSSACTNTL